MVPPAGLSNHFRATIILLSSSNGDLVAEQTFGLMPLRMVHGPFDPAFHNEGSVTMGSDGKSASRLELPSSANGAAQSWTIQPSSSSTLGRAATVAAVVTRIVSIGGVKRPIGGISVADAKSNGGILAEIELKCSSSQWLDLFIVCPSMGRFILTADNNNNVVAVGIVTRHLDIDTL